MKIVTHLFYLFKTDSNVFRLILFVVSYSSYQIGKVLIEQSFQAPFHFHEGHFGRFGVTASESPESRKQEGVNRMLNVNYVL